MSLTKLSLGENYDVTYPQIFMINPRISTKHGQPCLKTVLKVVFQNDFFICTNLNGRNICHVCKGKKYVFVANPQSAAFSEGPKI